MLNNYVRKRVNNKLTELLEGWLVGVRDNSLDGLVVRSRDNPLSIWADCYARDRARMTLELVHLIARLQIPHAERTMM